MSPLTTGPVVVIPAYQPSQALIDLITGIIAELPEQQIIVVNDGSTGNAKQIFTQLECIKNIIILHHAINLGKGQALKTAFNYYLLNYNETSAGVVTADADGQHTAKDIQTVIQHLKNSSSTFCLGSRKLDKQVPLRSRFGNVLTRKIFQLIMNESIYDTQSGLRGIPRFLLPDLMLIPTLRYEYELDMLMRVTRKDIEIKEIPIETIYIDGNKSSHFNPILDSLKIYFVFLRYLAASISSAIIDFIGFVFFYLFSKEIFFSLGAARILSGVFNFLLCKKMIFKSGDNTYQEAIKYLILAVFSLTLSYILVLGLVNDCGINLYISKILADVCVFLINFAIQKVIVFPVNALRD